MTEKEIITGCIKKNAVCQRLLFDQYSRKLMTLCLRYARTAPDAEDMLQESFIKIFSAIHQYRFEGSFEGWIKRVTVSVCLRKLQESKIRFDDVSALESTKHALHPDVIDSLSEKELMQLISSMPDGYRVVFNLSVMEGYTHDEIAALLNIEAVTSRSQLMKARRWLQKKILANQKITVKHAG